MEYLDKLPYDFNEEVKIVAYCPFCEVDLNPIKAKIVEDNQDLYLVHFQCNKCQGYILGLVLKNAAGLTSVGLITDLTYNDINKFKNKKPLTADDVLRIHQSFNKKDVVKEIIKLTR